MVLILIYSPGRARALPTAVRPARAGYERVEPGGEHHHAICRRCGRMVPFEDASLERAIAKLSQEMSFEVTGHDVVLRGTCERCGN